MTRPVTRTVAAAVGAVLLVLLGVVPVLGILGNEEGIVDHRSSASARTELVDVAKAQVIDLTTVNFDDVDAKIKALAGRSTGNFKVQVGGMASTFEETVVKNKVRAKGKVDSAAIVSMSDTEAEVIVASSATVSNSKEKAAKPRSYRVSVDLQRADGEGPWLVSNMEFVA